MAAGALCAVLAAWMAGDPAAHATADARADTAEPLGASAGDRPAEDPTLATLRAALERQLTRRRVAQQAWAKVLTASSVARPPHSLAIAEFAGQWPRERRPSGSGPIDTRGVCVLPRSNRVRWTWAPLALPSGAALRSPPTAPAVVASPKPKGGPFAAEVRWLQVQLEDAGLTDERIATLQLRLADARERQRRFPRDPR